MSQAQTPYSPPLAPVRDPAEPEVPKPPAIWWAVLCLWMSTAVVVLSASYGFASTRAGGQTAQAIATVLIGTGILALVALLLNARRGWVRWLFVVVYVLGVGGLVAGLALAPREFLARSSFAHVITIVQVVLQTAALVMMFTPAAGRWLRSRRK
jgi:peptidoglycan/LPS O-acetylase OafA/YrhL